ncbi:MAG: DNA/RNA helicase domain-containing protein [Mediterraneibacter gnavus]
MKYLRDSEEFKDKKIGFVVPQTSLRKTLKGIFRSIYGLKASDVLSPSDVTKQYYDILLVDEAHRLHQYKNISYMGAFKASCKRIGLTTESDELDWILHQCKCPVLFYDEMQIVSPSGIDVKRFGSKMKIEQAKRMLTYYSLQTQMRVKGGNDYIAYVKEILSGEVKSEEKFCKLQFNLNYSAEQYSEAITGAMNLKIDPCSHNITQLTRQKGIKSLWQSSECNC